MSASENLQDFSSDSSESNVVYTLETVEKITHISRDNIVLYYQYGLISSVKAPEKTDLFFDEEAIHQLRRIAFLLSEYGLNHDGVRMVASLLSEVERLRAEVRFLREK